MVTRTIDRQPIPQDSRTREKDRRSPDIAWDGIDESAPSARVSHAGNLRKRGVFLDVLLKALSVANA